MKKCSKFSANSGLISVIFGLLVCMSPAYAQVSNGDFESGLAGWTYTSATSSITNAMPFPGYWFVTPYHGSYMAQLFPDASINLATAEANLDLASGALLAKNASLYGPTTDYGTLTQSIYLGAGQTITVWWNYVCGDFTYINDGALATLTGPSSYQSIHTLVVNYNAYGDPETQVVGTFGGTTGWRSLTFTAGAAGTYTLGFACFNSKDPKFNSVLFVDYVTSPPASIPTLGEWGLYILSGLLLLTGSAFAFRRRTALVA